MPPNVDYRVKIDGEKRPMCCPGCRAVAQLITGSGLEKFYSQRTALNERPSNEVAESAQHYSVYDNPEINSSFTQIDEKQFIQARLLLGGISCAACTWLIEQTLTRLPGVEAAVVNLSQSRLDVTIDPQHITLGEIFRRVDELGYRCRPFRPDQQLEQMSLEYKTHLRQLAVAGLGMMQVGMFAIALHAGDLQGMESEYQRLLRWVSLLVASFVLVYSARPFFESAWRHLKAGALVMDLPVSLAIGLAWLASLLATLTDSGQVYFDSVVMFTFFLLLGRFLERRARRAHSIAWFDAQSTLPAAVKVLLDGRWQTVGRQQLIGGETIVIPQGEIVPADALIRSGQSSMDESTFNGEHLPRTVTPGDTIYAGTLNVSAALQACVHGSYLDSRLAALQRSVERAAQEKPAIAKLADAIAGRFVGLILLLTAATAISWSIIDPSEALWISLSVLVISCPCALALATPAALTGAANGLRSRGVIVRGENAIEALSRSSHLIFDKTGTLTEGKFELCETVTLEGTTRDDALRLGASLQTFSSHPLAAAFSDVPADQLFEQVNYEVGAGLEGILDGRKYRIGSLDFCSQIAPQLSAQPDDNHHWIALCRDDTPLAWFGLQDTVRDEARAVVSAAISKGLQVEMLTGDSSVAGTILGKSLGIKHVQCGISPAEKMAYVQRLQREGAIVTAVGDGLNDAPLLGVADASFAVAEATELARTQADFLLVGSNLHAVVQTLDTARKCRRIIQQNLTWALAYNLCGIPLAAAGYIPPWAAAIGMSASSLLVVINSLRLNRRPPR